MSNALLAYEFDEHPVRIVMVAGDPWFVANDLAKALGYTQAPHMVRMLDDDEKGIHIVDTLGGHQEMNIISESGMYAAVLKSRRDEARRFRKWVTSEVLPALRKTGQYQMHDLDPPPLQSIDLDPSRLVAGVSVVREARRLWGPAAARALWAQVGLPPCVVDSEAVFDGDPMAAPLKAYLADRAETTIGQAAEGMGIDEPDWSTRQRIGRLLAMWGWTQRTRKIGKRAARVFSRPASAMTIEGEA
ncbi:MULTISPECIES: Bro-N domain-containing protein [Novosphingobium]|uniref:BRO-N domain-containing protein n=1 Tax=Novosphingobium TaxID=165696 RepID=UPI000D317DE9|nr:MULTISPECIES: Bro-N domain-containing protein [Novosphingobium]PTR07861.1 BRO family protein [Novosphingobium sp. GV055]PUB00674.1 BRO family protein [Novosphingobium sp. GV061]PUB16083.1 BRO family protein [Novosphingobium sp. GV079]PUB39548.1 BRO family protein [Novosphingobium sp. GV027]WQD93783.1 Bro-N domain-containing protein [Novosphingobium capsulatum]